MRSVVMNLDETLLTRVEAVLEFKGMGFSEYVSYALGKELAHDERENVRAFGDPVHFLEKEINAIGYGADTRGAKTVLFS